MSRDEDDVRELGDRIGYGNMMQLAERIWNARWPGQAHSVGPCTAFLVECAHTGYEGIVECEWCCGSGRVTHRVARVMEALNE